MNLTASLCLSYVHMDCMRSVCINFLIFFLSECGGILSGFSGIINGMRLYSSPEFNHAENCVWEIDNHKAKEVYLKFQNNVTSLCNSSFKVSNNNQILVIIIARRNQINKLTKQINVIKCIKVKKDYKSTFKVVLVDRCKRKPH